MKKSTLILLVSAAVALLGWWLTKDAPLVMVGKDLVPDSDWYGLVLLGVTGLLWGGLMRHEEKKRAARRLQRRNWESDFTHKMKVRWSAETGHPQY